VNRYLHGTRVPAHFCAALVSGLGVNPAWLLAGEGNALLADTHEGTRRMAGDVLELVQAMNAVTRMRLGSLAGKHHLKVLRELNDALQNYEQLRERMNAHSRKLLAGMLDELREALARLDLTRAQDIRPAATQVARLCDDDLLRRDLSKLESHIEYLSGNYAGATKFQRRVFMHALMEGDITEPEFEELVRYLLTLNSLGRTREASRSAEAALHLFADSGFDMTWLEFFAAKLQTQLGNLREGMARMQAALPRLAGKRLAAAQADMAMAMLQAGTIDVPAAIAYGEDIMDKAVNIIRFATWQADARNLKLACEYHDSERVQRVRGKQARLTYPFLALRALQGDGRVIAEWKAQWPKSLTPLQQFDAEADLAQLNLLLGRKPAALRHVHAARERLRALPPDTAVDLLGLASLHRAALELKAGKAAESEARAFFAERVSRGYGCFAAWA
jgi:hypothetical protein